MFMFVPSLDFQSNAHKQKRAQLKYAAGTRSLLSVLFTVTELISACAILSLLPNSLFAQAPFGRNFPGGSFCNNAPCTSQLP